MTEREERDRQAACQHVLADLGQLASVYTAASIESVTKEYVINNRGWHLDYWHLVIVVLDLPVLHVQHPAKDIPCEACGTLYPATMLEYGACVTCWSMMPYALPLQG